MSPGQQEIARRLRQQAEWCIRLGSPLYERLLLAAAADVEGGGPTWALLAAHAEDPPGSALALRFMGATRSEPVPIAEAEMAPAGAGASGGPRGPDGPLEPLR